MIYLYFIATYGLPLLMMLFAWAMELSLKKAIVE